MSGEMVRPIAICVCLDGERILVAEGHDRKKRETFYRPLGGTIEFGEHGEETVRREFLEEIKAVLTEVRFLGLLENIFTYEGKRGHEVVLVYDGRLLDASLYQRMNIQGDEFGVTFTAMWKRLDEFGQGKARVYPEGILELLEIKTNLP
jgi:8-oxo-dGTP pyrophosphatase MutT (NUDIX family)